MGLAWYDDRLAVVLSLGQGSIVLFLCLSLVVFFLPLRRLRERKAARHFFLSLIIF